MPWTSTETVADGISSDRDGDGECDEGGDGSDAEDGANCNCSAEDEQGQADADACVEPDSIDGRLRVLIDPLPDTAKGETIVASISVSDSRSCDHASLTHGEAADNCQAEDRQSGFLRHNLNEVRCL